MNPKALARLACKILALYAFLEAVIYLQNAVPIVGYIQQRGWGDPIILKMILSVFSAFILLVIAGWLVWTQADRLAARISAGDTERDSKGPAKPLSPDLPATAVALLGLFILTLALPQLGGFLFTIIIGIIRPEVGQIQLFPAIYQALGILVKLGLGIWFFLGCHWFARTIARSSATKPNRVAK